MGRPALAHPDIRDLMARGPVIPVVVLDEAADAVPLARALLDGGISVIEITLRTEAGLAAARAVIGAVPKMVVGIGTILSATDFDAARATGAAFGVSPGATADLLARVAAERWPFLPGCATVSEAMAARAAGLSAIKVFPASHVGGPSFLKALGSVLPDLAVCPTGGIAATTAPDYLALKNVPCVGGSWICPPELIRARDWQAIRALAGDAVRLGRVRG